MGRRCQAKQGRQRNQTCDVHVWMGSVLRSELETESLWEQIRLIVAALLSFLQVRNSRATIFWFPNDVEHRGDKKTLL